ncbi:probable CDP-diacylglycerol--inositol 3-phosphatidyltransferase 2 [Tanacetum coccineum]|uniref:Probable CDP-diacylglycerol--inositol 3-phosphatidyltransferase 2 n=1 Tax=Tanacetum coccineum TaxID=301880 RepID=A0ABQ5AUS6_9ASTR
MDVGLSLRSRPYSLLLWLYVHLSCPSWTDSSPTAKRKVQPQKRRPSREKGSPAGEVHPELIADIWYIRVLINVFAFVICFTNKELFSILYFISFVCDALDGWFARKFNQVSTFGAVLDMITDRISTACLLVILSPKLQGLASFSCHCLLWILQAIGCKCTDQDSSRSMCAIRPQQEAQCLVIDSSVRINRGGFYKWEDHHPSHVASYGVLVVEVQIRISACDDHQNSADTSAFTGTSIGALTYSFIQAVQRASTIKFHKIRDLLRAYNIVEKMVANLISTEWNLKRESSYRKMEKCHYLYSKINSMDRCKGCKNYLTVPPGQPCSVCYKVSKPKTKNNHQVLPQLPQYTNGYVNQPSSNNYYNGSYGQQPTQTPPAYGGYYAPPPAPPKAVSPPIVYGNGYNNNSNQQPTNVHEKKKAVLCGVTYKGHKQTLPASVNNVRSMHQLLVKLGFPNASIRILTGHGSHVADHDGDEKDGYDEAICPVDYNTAGKILDDEVNPSS